MYWGSLLLMVIGIIGQASRLRVLFHLHRDDDIHLGGVLKRELLHHRIEESSHEHRFGILPPDSAGSEVEQVFLVQPSCSGLMGDGRRSIRYPHGRQRSADGSAIEQEPVASNACDRPDRSGLDIDQSTIDRYPP